MVVRKKTFSEMIQDGISYLAGNTDITYFGDGSIAKALIETTSLEISRLQDYITGVTNSAYLSTSSGMYLDLFGEMLGIERRTSVTAASSIEDGSVRFYVTSGVLGTRLPHPTDPKKGLIPRNTRVSNPASTVEYSVISDAEFPRNAKSAYAAVRALTQGADSNVGSNQLTAHSLGSDILVTNDISITSGSDTESDQEYRYRLSKAMTTRYGSNFSSILIAASTQPGIVDAKIIQYARGAGTFDVLLIPKGNKLTESSRSNVERIINNVAAFGIFSKVREPDYVTFKVVVQLRFVDNTSQGEKFNLRQRAQSAILNYIGRIPLGGEMIMNQLRTAVLSSGTNILDMKIIELCIDGKPRTIRNIKLKEDELFVPDGNAEDPVQVL